MLHIYRELGPGETLIKSCSLEARFICALDAILGVRPHLLGCHYSAIEAVSAIARDLGDDDTAARIWSARDALTSLYQESHR